MTRLAVLSGSCGKDSALALHYARKAGLDVRWQITMLEESGETSRSHGLPLALVKAQAAALGLELIAPSAGWKTYEEAFVGALKTCKDLGASVAVFGDIDLEPHREWEDRVCKSVGLEAVLPLWGKSRVGLAKEVISLGFKAVVCTIDRRHVPDDLCGADYNEDFLSKLPESVDKCGENGEFHTFVADGPSFSRSVPFRLDGFADYTSPPEYGSIGYRFAKLVPL